LPRQEHRVLRKLKIGAERGTASGGRRFFQRGARPKQGGAANAASEGKPRESEGGWQPNVSDYKGFQYPGKNEESADTIRSPTLPNRASSEICLSVGSEAGRPRAHAGLIATNETLVHW
jgi:hypothetical protein